jgi:uncharacterized protein (DUF58 family)
MTMRVSVQQLSGSDVCAGAVSGRELLVKLIGLAAREPPALEMIEIDFTGIEVATGSYLRESVLAFRDVLRRRKSKYYLVVSHLDEIVEEELVELLMLRSDALLVIGSRDSGSEVRIQPVGHLEPKQRWVFDLANQRGAIDATQLQKEFGEAEGVKQTAWNNRLANLANTGLLIEHSQGRNKLYKPVPKGAPSGR